MRPRMWMLMVLCMVGCAYKAPMMTGPVEVAGKVTQGGAAVGGFVLNLQPLESGHMTPLQVAADGSFKGQLVPGKYAYYVSESSSGDPASFAKIPASLREAAMDRTVTIAPGQSTVEIVL